MRDALQLTDLDFGQFKNLDLHNCPKLKNITCSDSNSKLLRTVKITNCPELQSLIIYGDGLTSINLSGCTNLESITLKGTDFSKLSTLDLQGTSVKYIYFSDLESYPNTSELNLTRFNNLCASDNKSNSYFKIGNNPGVVNIRVKNERTPFYLHYNLQGCTSLKRIYGHISLNCTECFYNDKNFSIHGPNLNNVRWGGKYVTSGGIVRMPHELLEKQIFDLTDNDMFRTETDATNISLTTTDATRDFYGTNCTIFDYYYFFSACTNVQNCTNLFGLSQNKQFGLFS
jgi:hypothetical protein